MKTLYLLKTLFLFSTISYAQWTQTNGPYAGRTTAMITVGDNLYAGHRDWGGTDGRVYRSSDLGQTWVGADNGIQQDFSIFYQFANIGETIIGAANYLYRTNNQGANWEVNDTGLFAQPLSVMADGNVFWCGTSGGGIFKSTDLAETWVPKNNGLEGTVIVYDIAKLGDYLFIGTAGSVAPSRIYRSADNGESWQLSNNGLPISAEVHDFTINGTTLFASTIGLALPDNQYGIYKSDDFGATWTSANNGLPNIIYGNTGRIYTYNGDVYVSTTYPGQLPRVFKSTDNGASFFEVSNGLENGNEVLSYTAAGGYLFSGSGNYSGVFRTSDGGLNWEEARRGLANAEVYCLMEHNGRLYAGTKEGLHYTTDMGANWTIMKNGIPYGLPIIAMETNGTNIYLGTEQYGVFRSTDSGNSWQEINNGFSGTFSDYVNDILYSNGTLYAATWDGIYKSVDNGDLWTLASAGLPTDGGSPVEVNTIIDHNGVLFAGTTMNYIYKSIDNGTTWTPSGNGLTTYASTVNQLFEVGSDILAATESGVYRSTDNGASWQVNPILWGGFFKEITAGNGVLYASQYGPTVLTGYGVFRSLDTGQTWETINDGMHDESRVMALAVYNDVLFGGTDTRSVWRYAETLATHEPVAKQSNISIIPNPSNGRLSIQIGNHTETVGVSIYNILGQEIYRTSHIPLEGMMAMDISDQPQGIYLAKIKTSGQMITKKIIIE